jgi:uncharacterized protein with NRDE domain
MCLIVLALNAHPGYALAIAANRDEYHERPSAPAGFWERAPQVLAGRDLLAGGTWLGITRGGRFAAVTNYRDRGPRREGGPSRGSLVGRFLEAGETPEEYARFLASDAGEYNGFSVLFGSARALWWFSNRSGKPAARLGAGIHGLSNGLLDEPWPKVVRGRESLASLLALPPESLADGAFRMLEDATPAPDDLLPDTGVSRELERALSPVFTRSRSYGTRSSTVLLIDRGGLAVFAERTFDASGGETGRVRYDFTLEPPCAP